MDVRAASASMGGSAARVARPQLAPRLGQLPSYPFASASGACDQRQYDGKRKETAELLDLVNIIRLGWCARGNNPLVR